MNDVKERIKKDTILLQTRIEEIRECLELLLSIEIIEYHNKNLLPMFAIKDPKAISEEKLALIERALSVVGTSSRQRHT